MWFLSFKALHLIFMVCWFAALFYLPRLFVHHAIAQSEQDIASQKRFEVMERRLYLLGLIGMKLTFIFGITMLFFPVGKTYLTQQGWLHAKLLLVVGLVVYYVHSGTLAKRFAQGKNDKNHRYYRIYNEAPTLALIFIIFLAVLKPF